MESTPLIQTAEPHNKIAIEQQEGRPTLPLPLVIAHRLQLYFASTLLVHVALCDFLMGLICHTRMQGKRIHRYCWTGRVQCGNPNPFAACQRVHWHGETLNFTVTNGVLRPSEAKRNFVSLRTPAGARGADGMENAHLCHLCFVSSYWN